MVVLALVNHLFKKKLGDRRVALVLGLHLRRRCTKSKKGLVTCIVNSHGLA